MIKLFLLLVLFAGNGISVGEEVCDEYAGTLDYGCEDNMDDDTMEQIDAKYKIVYGKVDQNNTREMAFVENHNYLNMAKEVVERYDSNVCKLYMGEGKNCYFYKETTKKDSKSMIHWNMVLTAWTWCRKTCQLCRNSTNIPGEVQDIIEDETTDEEYPTSVIRKIYAKMNEKTEISDYDSTCGMGNTAVSKKRCTIGKVSYERHELTESTRETFFDGCRRLCNSTDYLQDDVCNINGDTERKRRESEADPVSWHSQYVMTAINKLRTTVSNYRIGRDKRFVLEEEDVDPEDIGMLDVVIDAQTHQFHDGRLYEGLEKPLHPVNLMDSE